MAKLLTPLDDPEWLFDFMKKELGNNDAEWATLYVEYLKGKPIQLTNNNKDNGWK